MHRNGWIWLAIAVLCVWLLWLAQPVLLPFIVGALLAYMLDPVTDRLETRLNSRGLAAGLVTVICFSILILLAMLLLPLLGKQLSELLLAAPGYLVSLRDRAAPYFDQLSQHLDAQQVESVRNGLADSSSTLFGIMHDVLAATLNSGAAVLNLASLLLITPVVAFYLLRDWDMIKAQVDELIPRAQLPMMRAQLHAMDRTLSGFVRGQLHVCVILAAYYGGALTLAGLPYGLIIGLLTGFMAVLPYIGFLLGLLASLAIAFTQADSHSALIAVAAVFALGQVIESYILTPKLVGNKVGLHPVWVLFALLAGGLWFGFFGVLLAVPVAAMIGVWVRFGLQQYRHSALYHGLPAPRRTP